MIWGTGPDRGTPWWRWRRSLTLTRAFGLTTHHEVPGAAREGRTVAVIGRP